MSYKGAHKGSTDEVLESFNCVDPNIGLSISAITNLRKIHGENKLNDEEKVFTITRDYLCSKSKYKLLHQEKSPLISIIKILQTYLRHSSNFLGLYIQG